MIISTWNIRGLNDPNKVEAVRRFIRRHKIQIIAILETGVKVAKKDKIIAKLVRNWSWIHNYSYSPRGRIWLGWNVMDIVATVEFMSSQVVTVRVTDS